MQPKTLVGKMLLFQNVALGIITEVVYGHVVWSHTKEWRFKLDCGAWLRDFRNNPKWQVERSE